MRRQLIVLAAVAAALVSPAHSQTTSPCPDALLFRGSKSFTKDGNSFSLKAQVEFEKAGSDLKVTLANIAPFMVDRPEQILTGVFFDVGGAPDLRVKTLNQSATPQGMQSPPAYFPGYPDVGGEWGFRYDIGNRSGDSGLGVGQAYGIGAAGFGLFQPGSGGNPGDRFGTINLSTPPPNGSLADADYGITTAIDEPGLAGAANGPLVQDRIVFTLTGLDDLGCLEVTNVRFQYGSGLGEPSFQGCLVPEPGTMSLLGLGAVSLVAKLRRRRAPAAVEEKRC
jgi:hypothetical protein